MTPDRLARLIPRQLVAGCALEDAAQSRIGDLVTGGTQCRSGERERIRDVLIVIAGS
ncbi:hypothetical protein [Propionicicella superfundia]|uniref:hypothetical protein n=1 Tax=Propionicicella superfundia TaxID=348582 RepID=UPI0012EB111A|nr:hypothetical protein [Propionicicella superfundia]